MKYTIPFALYISIAILVISACFSSKNTNTTESIFWINSFKSEADIGAGKTDILSIYRGRDFNNPQWESFYPSIEGFEFEEGYFQRIKVSEKHLEKNQIPADASSIQYTLIEVLEKQKDLRINLNGNWILASINTAPINRMVIVPRININLPQKLISGNSGCNNFTASIQNLSGSNINLSEIASTKKMCINKNIEPDFLEALNHIYTYQIKDNHLNFLDPNGNKKLSFIRNEETLPINNLHDIWTAIRIDGSPINRMSPTPNMELNLKTMQVMGNDGCNDYTGKIETVTDSALKFGSIISTEKFCSNNMQTADSYNKALNKVTYYKIESLHLTLYDNQKKEVLAFLKVD